jgi:hypothetical protein
MVRAGRRNGPCDQVRRVESLRLLAEAQAVTCGECKAMLASPTEEPRRMAEYLARSPLLFNETKRSDGAMVSLWRCSCGQLWQRALWDEGKQQFWTPQADPAPPPSSIRRPRF